MATREAKFRFAIKRFQGFVNTFRKSKRGMAGAIVVIFFTIIAIIAPLLTSNDPIDPMMHKGEFPGLYQRGPPIAYQLCYPSWYKYLPWIYKGTISHEEEFHNNIETYKGQTFQMFGPIGQQPTDDVIYLSYVCVQPPQVEATFPNGTSRTLSSPQEWIWETTDPQIIKIPILLPPETRIKVKYNSATDITENLEVIQDFHFKSEETFEKEWRWSASTNAISVQYNTLKGTGNDGCIEVKHASETTADPSQKATLKLMKPFEYPYWEPPRIFWGYMSVFVSGIPGVSVNITVGFQREGGDFSIIRRYTKSVSSGYTEEVISFTIDEARQIQTAFLTPGNFSYIIEMTFNNSEETTVYLDNVYMVLYGNAYGLLGTDNDLAYPRDIFSTLVYGTRVSLIVGVFSALFGTLIGLFLGLISGYVGGLIDEFIMRVADLFLVIPTLPLFIVLVVALKVVYGFVSLWNIIIVLTLFGWMGFARTVRSMVLSLRERAFVEAAKASGATSMYIINHHILPNVFALVYITLATSVPGAIVTEASLSWLGLGDPTVASWGKLLYDFESSGVAITRGLTEYWFWIFPASFAIALLAAAFILMGFALDEILNPRLRQRR
jgi:ABC-type dipeptide/oligopeptide/nickel transport system permease subunit